MENANAGYCYRCNRTVGGALLKVLEPAGSIIAASRRELDLAQPNSVDQFWIT